TAKDLGVTDVWDPEQNVDAGVRYLSRLLAKYGSEHVALAAYNWGPGYVDKALSAAHAFPAQVETYTRNVLARKAEEAGLVIAEGTRIAASPFSSQSDLSLSCPHCSQAVRVRVELELRK